MLKISKIFIVLVFIAVVSSVYEFIHEALKFKEDNENKARENLSALIKQSENEGKEELKYAKNLSKETYNQEKVTQMIIKNLKIMQASIEDMKTLSSYYPTEEDVELMRQAGHIIFNLNSDIISYLLHNERNITNHQTYFLFDKERFKVFEDFLFFLNTHLEEDFLQKDIDSFTIIETTTYINMLINFNRAFVNIFSQDYICDLNNLKTITIIKGMSQIDFATDRILLFLNKKLKIYTDNYSKEKLKKMISHAKTFKLDQKQINELKSLQTKLKECTNE
ncbi:TPA: hypothetical protein RTH03_000411 [Campylobacter jejuni]|nr:hypothetical protein [Campylobacter jejuni]HDZ5087885.1 hypothetical protein [Campylobacter jejuni]